MKFLLLFALISSKVLDLHCQNTNDTRAEGGNYCPSSYIYVNPSDERAINKKVLFIIYDMDLGCRLTRGEITCNDGLFKADFKLTETIVVLDTLQSNTKYVCKAVLFNDNQPLVSGYDFKFQTSGGIHIERLDFNSITCLVEYDGNRSIDNFFLKLDYGEYPIIPYTSLRIDNLPSCKTFDVQLFGREKDKVFNLGATSVTVEPDELIFSTINQGYYQIELSAKFNRINSVCSTTAAYLQCDNGISIDVVFQDHTATFQITDLKPRDMVYCNLHVTFDHGINMTYGTVVRTNSTLEGESINQNEISMVFHYDGVKRYDHFNLLNQNDRKEMRIIPEEKLIISNVTSCKKYDFEVVGITAQNTRDVLDHTSVTAVPDDPIIKHIKAFAFRHEVEISYPQNSFCVPEVAYISCTLIASVPMINFVKNSGKFVLTNLQSNREYICSSLVYLNNDHSRHELAFSFTTKKAIVAKSTRPNEISLKFTYDGDKKFDSFSIKSNEFNLPIKSDDELIIKDLEADREYTIELFGELADRPDVILGSEKVMVMGKGHEKEEKPPCNDKQHLKISSFNLELN